MRLFITIIVSCLLGVAIAVGSIEYNNKSATWFPELETQSKYTTRLATAKKGVNPNAKAFVPEDEHDFGVLNRKQEGKHDFIVENRGTENLTLAVNGTSCTCTGVDVSNKNVKPGDKSIITVHWNAENSQATFTQSAALLTNDPSNIELIFRVKGLYTSPVMTNPGSLQFPSIALGREGNASFRLYGLEKKPLEIKDIRCSDPEHFEATFEPSELTDADKESSIYKSAANVWVAKIKVKPGLPTGAFQERIIISTNYESEPTLEYFVKGMVQAANTQIAGKDYVRETGAINIGKTSLGKPISSKINVIFLGKSSDAVDLSVAKVEPDFMEVEIEKVPSERQAIFSISVKIPATTAGYWNGPDQKNMGSFELQTNVSDSPTLKFPVQFLVEGH